tara:strand:- start:1714 stop:1995 length:282 start_codon:yes stop_codon:yes gene_type:complete
MKKTREDVTKEILDVDFDDTTKAKVFDDDGYEDGKSKDREMKMADVSNKDKLSDYKPKGGLLYKGKAKDYPGAAALIKKNKAKVIPINIGKKK